MAKSFTPEEINILKENPYTAYVGERMLTFTRDFKEHFMVLYREGMPPRKILPMLGYSVEIIGKSRLNGICQQIRLQEISDKGLRAGRGAKPAVQNTKNPIHNPGTETFLLKDLSRMDADHQLLLDLQKELEVLRSEIQIIRERLQNVKIT